MTHQTRRLEASAVLVALTSVLVLLVFRGRIAPNRASARTPAATPPPARQDWKPEPTSAIFDTFGPMKASVPGPGWAAGSSTHGEWFVFGDSGRLNTIEIAIEPSYAEGGRETMAGDATVFLARDANGRPGKVVERFQVPAWSSTAPAPAGPVTLKSSARPVLRAGQKYWLCARCGGPGLWGWHFSPRDSGQTSVCEREPGEWISTGNAQTGAFRITVTEAAEQEQQ